MTILDKGLKLTLKSLTSLLKLTKFGSGTALPGKLIENVYPGFIQKLTKGFGEIIFVTGTNGKTSVASMAAKLYEENGFSVTINKEGSNMMRGIISTLVNTPLPKSHKNALILEVEEATIVKLSKLITPQYIIVTNIFRDQLDAYGEITRVKNFIKQGILNCPEAIIIYNSSDPLVNEIVHDIPNEKYAYCLSEELDIKFKYEKSNHPRTKTNRLTETAPIINFINSIDHVFSQTVVVSIDNEAIQYDLNLTGIYNILNSLAILTLGKVRKFDIEKIISSLEKIDPAFGRGEKIIIPQVQGRNIKQTEIRLFLAKNPAGYEQILEVIKNEPKSFTIPNIKHVFILNDNIADGRDVSWIWDIDFSKSNLKLPACICSGTRAEDIGLRLKYAEVSKSYTITPDIQELIEDIVDNPSKYRVICTYTGMLEFRKYLRKYLPIKHLQ